MKRRRRFRSYEVPKYIKEALEILRPPEDITVSEWAEKYRILDSKSSNIPGAWRNSVTPYLQGIMDEFNRWETEEIIFCKPTQVGGTEALQNMLGYIVAQDPAPTMIVYPTDVLAETTSENRIIPMLKNSPSLREHYNGRASSKTELQFDNMYITLAGSNSPSSLASKPIRYLFLDEVDKYPAASKKEADPISLARERTKTFVNNRKIYMCSTPTLRSGHIWAAKEAADREKHYFVPCPHCGVYIELKMNQIKWPGKETGMSDLDRVEFANYVCQECGEVITDQHKAEMLRHGEWQTVREKGKSGRSVAFWINTLYSPFTRFSEIAKEFIKSHDDPDRLHNFANSWLAEPWEDTKLRTNADLVLENQTDLQEYIVPAWTKLLTGGVDVQENCLYWTVRAWGDFLTSQNVAHGQVLSLEDITNVMNMSFQKEDGGRAMVDLCLIDSGDQTDAVYDYCIYNTDWLLPCKGTQTMLSHYRLSTVNKPGSKAVGLTLVLVDGGKYKDMIYARMKKERGMGAWMVYAGCDQEYAEQVTAEQKIVERANGRERTRWQLKSSHADNHYLDCEVYAAAAADILGVRNLFLQNKGEQEGMQIPQTPTARNAEPEAAQKGNRWIPECENWIGGM
ncbi:MAG: phage terminase large subunit family protein [Eubacteriales bacterium]|nr:phage terminase large subunit family protein [Eubacteriales bacterium]